MKDFFDKHRKVFNYVIILLVGLYLSIPVLNKHLDVYYDDGIQHIARAFGQVESNGFLGNVIPMFTNGFGYSWNLFYGPLSSFGIIIFHVLTNNYINAYKLLIVTCMILSGIAMFKFVLKTSKNQNTALLAAILYMSFPYHLTDMYIRNALGEYISFCFIPLVFLGTYNLINDKNKSYPLIIGAVGLIITHNISTILVAIFAIFYIIVNLDKFITKRVLKEFFIDLLLILLISSFYWLPFIETALYTNYQAYEDGMMTTSESTAGHGLSINQLFVTKNNGLFVFELGPHIWIMLALSVMGYRLMSKDHKSFYIIFLVSSIISIWMSTKYFPWKLLPNEMCLIQFPWRMLMMAGFFLSTLCAYNITVIIKNFNIKDVAVISIIAIGYITAFYPFLRYDTGIMDINNYTLGVMSGKEMETVAGTAKAEYLPVKAYNHRFEIATRDGNIYVLKGKAIIENEQKNGLHYEAKIKTLDEEYTILELPYVYYPGYSVKLDGMPIQYFESENGFVESALLKNEDGLLTVDYSGTKLMKVSLFVSIISTIVSVVIIIKNNKGKLEK